MKMSALISTVAAAILLTAPASAQDKPNPSRKEQIQKSAKVKELQKERLETLTELAAAVAKLHQSGRLDCHEVIEAREMLFKAQLEAAEKESDRVALYKNMVDVWKQFEELAQQRVNAARGATVAVLKFKAMRLDVVDKDDVAHQREIVVRNELDDTFVISGGVNADDRIIFEGTGQVSDGEQVKYEFHPPDQSWGKRKARE